MSSVRYIDDHYTVLETSISQHRVRGLSSTAYSEYSLVSSQVIHALFQAVWPVVPVVCGAWNNQLPPEFVSIFTTLFSLSVGEQCNVHCAMCISTTSLLIDLRNKSVQYWLILERKVQTPLSPAISILTFFKLMKDINIRNISMSLLLMLFSLSSRCQLDSASIVLH